VPAAGSFECTSKTSTYPTLSDMTDRLSGSAEVPGTDLTTGDKKGLTPLLASQRVPHEHVLPHRDPSGSLGGVGMARDRSGPGEINGTS